MVLKGAFYLIVRRPHARYHQAEEFCRLEVAFGVSKGLAVGIKSF